MFEVGEETKQTIGNYAERGEVKRIIPHQQTNVTKQYKKKKEQQNKM